MSVRSFSTSASSIASRRVTANSLLRVSQACETLLEGFNKGQAAALRSCLVPRDRALSVSKRNGAAHWRSPPTEGGVSEVPPRDFLPPVRTGPYLGIVSLCDQSAVSPRAEATCDACIHPHLVLRIVPLGEMIYVEQGIRVRATMCRMGFVAHRL